MSEAPLQAETYYKMAIDRVAMKGGQAGPTVIAPPEYRTRFREAMGRNFVAAYPPLSRPQPLTPNPKTLNQYHQSIRLNLARERKTARKCETE